MLRQIHEIPIASIRVQKQVRSTFDPASVAELAASLKAVGLQQPIRVRRDGDGYWLIDGERRLRAARIAGFETIDAIVEEEPLSPAEITQRQLICNCQREDLAPLEKAAAIDQLMSQTGWNEGQVAAKLGLSGATVTRLLSLLQLPASLRERVASGEIGPSAGYELARVSNPAEQAELARQLTEGTVTRDGLAGRNKAARRPAPTNSAQPVRGRIHLGGGRSITVAGPRLTTESLIDWLEELLAKARKARTQGLELATLIKVICDQAKAHTTTPV